MKNKIALIILGILLAFSLQGQNQVRGTIENSSKERIFFSTVILYHFVDNKYVASTSTDEAGVFLFENISNGAYYLEVRMLGYETSKHIKVQLPEDHQRDFNITLIEANNLLEEVEVVGKIPLLEQRADRLVVNVENSFLSSSGSLIDAMRAVPGIIISNNRVRMAGQNNVTILVNGKSTRYVDIGSFLQDMPAENIKQIEVIHQPGAEFEAAGTGVLLNIILKKKSLLGTNASARIGIRKDYKWLPRATLFLSHNHKKISVNGFAGAYQNGGSETLEVTRTVGDDIYQQISTNPNNGNTLGANIDAALELTENQSIGLAGQVWGGRKDQLRESTTDIDFSDELLEDLNLQTQNNTLVDWSSVAINPYYKIHFDTTAHSLDADLNYYRYNRSETNLIQTFNLSTINSFFPGQQFEQPGTTNIGALKINYTRPLNRMIQLSTGIKYSLARLDNDLRISDEIEENVWVKNTNQSNHFLFDEDIRAVYTKLNFDLGRWSGTLGLRFEDSYSKGESLTTNAILDRRISKLFPSFSLKRELTRSLATSVAYSYRIDRPGYFDLNPFTTNLDPFTAIRGNPSLIPALTHSTKWNFIFKGRPFLGVEYKYINDPLVEVTEQNDETGESFLNTVNLDNQQLLNIELFFPLDFVPGVSGYGGVITNYNRYDSEYLDEDFLRSRWTYTAFVRSRFNLPGKIKAELGGSYVSGLLDGIMSLDNFFSVQAGIGRNFMDNQLRLHASFDDIIVRYRRGEIDFSNMEVNFLQRWIAPRFNFSVTYRFGNQFLKKMRNRELGGQEEINRSKN